MGQLIGESLSIFFSREVAVLSAPSRYGVDDPTDHLAHASLALGGAESTPEVLRDHHLGRHQGPGLGNLHIQLLKHDLTFFIGDRRRPLLPVDLVEWIPSCTAKISLDF